MLNMTEMLWKSRNTKLSASEHEKLCRPAYDSNRRSPDPESNTLPTELKFMEHLRAGDTKTPAAAGVACSENYPVRRRSLAGLGEKW